MRWDGDSMRHGFRLFPCAQPACRHTAMPTAATLATVHAVPATLAHTRLAGIGAEVNMANMAS